MTAIQHTYLISYYSEANYYSKYFEIPIYKDQISDKQLITKYRYLI